MFDIARDQPTLLKLKIPTGFVENKDDIIQNRTWAYEPDLVQIENLTMDLLMEALWVCDIHLGVWPGGQSSGLSRWGVMAPDQTIHISRRI